MQSHDVNDLYDFLVINEEFQDNWIDKEENIFLFTNTNQVLDMYLNGLEDNYIPCFHTGEIYSTDSTMQKSSLKNLNFSDVSFYSETDLPILKKNQYEFFIGKDNFKVLKVRLIGCENDWESIGIKSKNLQNPVLLPIKIESYKLSERDKIFIRQSVKKVYSHIN